MKTTLRSTAVAAIVAGLHLTAPLHGQAVDGDTVPRYTLPGVTVTATRTPIDRRVVPQKVDVVTSGEIERTGARDVAEALRASTPLDVIAYPGLLTGVSVRGFRPEYSGVTARTLVLVDGRPAGTNNLALLDVGGVERVEVLRGPGSALYGSSAMGGVVNVITRRSAGGIHGGGSAGYGAFGRYEARFHGGGAVGGAFDFDLSAAALGQRGGYRVGSRRTFSDGFLRKTLADGTTAEIPWTAPDSVLSFSEFASRTGALRIGRGLGDVWRVDVRGDAYLGHDVENPGDLTPQDWDTRSLKDLERRSAEVQLSGDYGTIAPRLRAYTTLESVDYYSAPAPPHFVNFRTPVRTTGAQLQSAVALGTASLTIGADYHHARAESRAFVEDGVPGAPYTPDSAIRSGAAFVQGLSTSFDDRLSLSAGLRADRITFEILETPHLTGTRTNEETHDVLSPNFGARLTAAPRVQLYGNVGSAFVTPDPFYVAGYAEQRAGLDRRAVFVTRGNPRLRPERSVTWDAGVTLFDDRSGLEADVGYFRTRVRDRIATSFSAPSNFELSPAGDTILSVTTYLNADEAAIQGVEARLAYDLGAVPGTDLSLRLSGSATRILRAEEHFAASGLDRRIRNVADLTAVAGVDVDSRRGLSARLSARYVGERVDSDYVAWWAPGEILYPAYLVADFSTRLAIGANYSIGLDIRNLTDEDYFEVRGYDQPGRGIFVRADLRM